MSLDCGEETRGYILDINGYNVTILEKKKENGTLFFLAQNLRVTHFIVNGYRVI